MGIRVLSLFDGIACGMQALKNVGIKVDKYYASEIDTNAIKVAIDNHPEIEEIGDVTKIDFNDYVGKVDLIMGGSPCQGFSVAGKKLNFEDPRSKLILRFAEALRIIKPKYFLLENVKMKKEWVEIISQMVGAQPIDINSSLVSAQNRRRLYWTNIPGVSVPEDRGIMLTDVVHEYNGEVGDFLDKYKVPIDESFIILDKEVERGKVGYFRKDSQANRVYYIHGKSVTLTGESGGGAAKMGQYLFGYITPGRINKRQNGQRFNNGNKSYTLTVCDRHGVLVNGYIRKLTPTECERLQTLPDGYTDVGGTSDAQRYKMLGNAWTVDVISHLLTSMKEDMDSASKEG